MRLLATALLLPGALIIAASPPPVPATDPIRAIIAAFDHANLVGLGERHTSIDDLEFRLRLIRDPAFANKVDDIVIEFASPYYQSTLDRFVNGEDVPDDELKEVWKNTTQEAVGTTPVYDQFVRGVRAVNATLPPGKRLRVVAGDFPYRRGDPGDGIHNGVRDETAAEIIRREVLDKNHKALVVFGSWHFVYHRPEFLARMFPNGNMVMLLHDDPRAKWFVVTPLSGPETPWPVTAPDATPQRPAWIATKTALDMDAAALGWADRPHQFQMRDLVDAVVYFGPKDPVLTSRISRSVPGQ